MVFELPRLEFEYNSLEPSMDAKTVEIHYSKHHATYRDKFNAALEKHPEMFSKSAEEILMDLKSVPEDIKAAVINFGGGFVNHNFFWSILSPKKQEAEGEILSAINKDFGSFENFKKQFAFRAMALFGSGWTWLVLNKQRKLEIVNTGNQDSPLSKKLTPLLVIDVWEHAYYIKYMNKRADFIEAFWNIINWKRVNKLYENAKK